MVKWPFFFFFASLSDLTHRQMYHVSVHTLWHFWLVASPTYWPKASVFDNPGIIFNVLQIAPLKWGGNTCWDMAAGVAFRKKRHADSLQILWWIQKLLKVLKLKVKSKFAIFCCFQLLFLSWDVKEVSVPGRTENLPQIAFTHIMHVEMSTVNPTTGNVWISETSCFLKVKWPSVNKLSC